jgi:hypothetical protein|tara:strand:+ start:3617 stop:3904 length:288 start_codon:yes stop_codon:yes gene_type:complete
MTELEKKQAIEILRLRSLCRYAAFELRALDDIIAQRHPSSSGLPANLVESLEEKNSIGYIKKYDDLNSELTKILYSSLESFEECSTDKELADLKI